MVDELEPSHSTHRSIRYAWAWFRGLKEMAKENLSGNTRATNVTRVVGKTGCSIQDLSEENSVCMQFGDKVSLKGLWSLYSATV